MKHILFLLLIHFVSTNAFCQVKQDTSCSGASSQTDYYKCLIKDYIYRDKQLNELYKKVIKKLGQKNLSTSIKTLRESERSWVDFRNKYGKVYEGLYSGGTMMPITVLECQIKVTKCRIEELNELYEDVNR